MQGIFIIIAIAWLIYASIAKKKKAEQQAQRQKKLNDNVAAAERQAAFDAPRQPGAVQHGAWTCSCGYTNAASSKFCRQCGTAYAMNGSMNYASSEGMSVEGGGGLKRQPLARENMPKPSLKHVVKPMTESSHSHTESSIFGDKVKCDELYTEIEDAYSGTEQHTAYAVDMADREGIIQGILYSEILSKPKALRR